MRPQPYRRPGARARGFTLIEELVVSLMLIGLLALAAAPSLLRLPLAAWSEASLRAGLGRNVEAAHTRFTLDLQRALPHSVRVRQVGARTLVEFMAVRASGRLRAGVSGAAQACPASCSAAGANDMLEAGCADDCFTTLGPLLGDAAQAGDWVVVGAQGAGVPGGDPWFGGNLPVAGGIKLRLTALAAAPDGQRLQIDAHAYPALPPDRRVWLVAQAVTLECDPAGRRLLCHSGYPKPDRLRLRPGQPGQRRPRRRPRAGPRAAGRAGWARLGALARDDPGHAAVPGRAAAQRGSVLWPIRNSSTARAAWRPSRIAQTTSDWPRRMSPAA